MYLIYMHTYAHILKKIVLFSHNILEHRCVLKISENKDWFIGPCNLHYFMMNSNHWPLQSTLFYDEQQLLAPAIYIIL